MYIRIIGNSFTENVFKEILVLTDSARLFFREIKYDEAKRIITLPIQRFGVIGKRRFFGSRMPYKYDKNKKIFTLVTIRNIEKCNIINNIDDPLKSEIIIMFGIGIRGKDIIISSAEEYRGTTRYSMMLTVNDLDIEIIDRSDEGSGA
jgi:hypothetical protein